ncbi:MAG TPA: 4-hydroxy-3-methylbut-2-enyl diphosphate reductase [bacterium]|nr:4-hydroxy-3-methylbut-2-enyl diphosphate reductase [bacterium]
MKVKVARTAGFCSGVRRAVNIALDSARDQPGPIYTLGPLIHNPHVVRMLEADGVVSVRDIPDAGSVVIRSHGVGPDVIEEVERRGLELVNATCPRVAAVHKIARTRHERGALVVVLGDPGHAEVDGIVGHAGGEAIVVRGPEDVAGLPAADMVCLVAQTTQERERFQQTARAVREKYRELPPDRITIADTICDSTRNRQEEVRRLAKQVDAMVVVGGRDSANTRRLAEVAVEEGVPAFLVDTEEDLDRAALARFKTVGLTAGASTPNWLIRRVHDELVQIGRPESWKSRAVFALRFLVLGNIYMAVGAAALTLAAARMQGFSPYWREYAISLLFTFAVHTMLSLADPRALALNVPARAKSFTRFRTHWIAASIAAAAAAVALAFTFRPASGLAMLMIVVMSLLYPVRLFPVKKGALPARSLAEAPGSKDIFMALGWATLTVALPVINHLARQRPVPATLAALVMVSGLVFVRALLRDFRDIQADRLIGRDTLPILLGVTRTRRLLYATLIAVAVILAAAAMAGFVPAPLGYLLLIPLAYAAACVPLFTRETILQGFRAEAIIDAAFIIAGIIALAA